MQPPLAIMPVPGTPLTPLAFATTTVAPSVTYSTGGSVVVVGGTVVVGATVVLVTAGATAVVVVASSVLSSSSPPPQAAPSRPRTATPASTDRRVRVVVVGVGSIVARVTAGTLVRSGHRRGPPAEDRAVPESARVRMRDSERSSAP